MATIVLTKDELIELMDERLEKALSKIQPSKQAEETLLTRHDLMAIFGVSLVTINSWCKKNILNPMHMNSRVYFDKSEVFQSLREGKLSKRNPK